MIHYLTVGFIDPHGVQRRETHVVRPLPADIRSIIARYADNDGSTEPLFEGQPVLVDGDLVRCPWFTPRRNRTAERFCRFVAQSLGCVIADVEHGRLINVDALDLP